MKKILLLAAVCFVSISSPTFGAIVYSGSQVTLQLSPMNHMSMMTIDIADQSDKWDDFTISLEYTDLMDATGMSIGMGTRLTILGGMGAMGMGEVVGMDMMGMGQAFNLDRGSLIDRSSPLADQGLAVLLSEGYGGQTINGEFGASGGYIGLVMPGSAYYGWLHLSVISNIGTSNQSVTFDGWAYDDQPGTPIGAGAIPLPGALVLGGLGIGLVTWLRRRRAI
jgi:hypothetical protein